MPVITDVSVRELDVPIRPGRESLSAAYATAGSRFSGALVAITADDGSVGYAEAPARPYVYGDTAATIQHVCRLLGARLVGRDIGELAALRAEMDVPRGVAGNLIAKGALDVALHDLRARTVGMPLYELLGGHADGTPRVRTTYLLPLHDEDRVLVEAEEAAAAGFTTFKVKVGRRDPRDDVALIARLRRDLGDGAVIYADANSGYTAAVAANAVRAMAEHGLAWIEDPCPVDLPRQQRARLAAGLPVPVLGDASCFTPRDVLRELEDGLVSMVMVKLARNGYTGARTIVEICTAAGVPCVIGTQGEMDLGSVAAGHLAASHQGFHVSTELSFFARAAESNLTTPLEMRDAGFDLPIGPGLAVTPRGLDQDGADSAAPAATAHR